MWNIFSKNLKIADTRSVQTDGPPVYPCLPAAPLSRSVESYLSDIPPIQEAQAWPSLLYVEWILQWILNIAILNCKCCNELENAAPGCFIRTRRARIIWLLSKSESLKNPTILLVDLKVIFEKWWKYLNKYTRIWLYARTLELSLMYNYWRHFYGAFLARYWSIEMVGGHADGYSYGQYVVSTRKPDGYSHIYFHKICCMYIHLNCYTGFD